VILESGFFLQPQKFQLFCRSWASRLSFLTRLFKLKIAGGN
jgi:hypothetical protein